MKKLLRWILIFLVFAFMAALSAITALACSPDDNNPEHHENVIQTDEEKPTCLDGRILRTGMYRLRDGAAPFPSATMPCLTNFGPWEDSVKEPTCTKAGDEASLLQYMQQVVSRCSCRQRATAGMKLLIHKEPYLHARQENTTPTALELPCEPGRAPQQPATGHSLRCVWKRVFATCTTPGYTEFCLRRLRRGWGGPATTTPPRGSQLRRVVYHDAGHLHGGRHAEAGVRNLRCDGDKIDRQDGT